MARIYQELLKTCVEISEKGASFVKKTDKIYNTAVEATLEVIGGKMETCYSLLFDIRKET
ncbi:hypothetical protein D3C73_499370 [compost metagenome]